MSDTSANPSLFSAETTTLLAARRTGRFNLRGMIALALKETHRSLKIATQTILAPVVMAVVLFAVMIFGFGQGAGAVGFVSMPLFLASGLVMATAGQSAFFSPSNAMVLAKIQGYIADILMPPLSPLEITAAFALSGLLRGLAVAFCAGFALWWIVPSPVLVDPGVLLFYVVMGSLMMSTAGFIAGVLANRFEQLGLIQSVIVAPLTFLSGTFFSIQQVPPAMRALLNFNPVFYMIDGFRSGVTGQADAVEGVGVLVMLAVNVLLFLLAQRLVARGTRLKT